MNLTDANASEWRQLALSLLPGRVYVTDRGYAVFELFKEILEIGSSFVCRVRDNSVYELIEERAITPEASTEGVGIVSDRLVYLGSDGAKQRVDRPLRLIEIKCTPHRKRTHGARGALVADPSKAKSC